MQLWVAIIYLRSFSNQKYLFKRLNVHPRELGNGNFIRSATQPTGPGNRPDWSRHYANACGASVFGSSKARPSILRTGRPLSRLERARQYVTIRHGRRLRPRLPCARPAPAPRRSRRGARSGGPQDCLLRCVASRINVEAWISGERGRSP
jgi:hypothetical protein